METQNQENNQVIQTETLEEKCESIENKELEQKVEDTNSSGSGRYFLGALAYTAGLLGSGFYQGFVGEEFFPKAGTEITNADAWALISASAPIAMSLIDSFNSPRKYAPSIPSKIARTPIYSLAVCGIGYALGKWYKS